jgi:hypothetical protein
VEEEEGEEREWWPGEEREGWAGGQVEEEEERNEGVGEGVALVGAWRSGKVMEICHTVM